MKTLLITGIGGDIAQGVARIVRIVRPDWRIIGVDVHERHGGRLFVDALELVCPVSDPGYLRQLEQIVSRYQVDVCLPMSEAELGFIVSNDLMSFGAAPLLGVARRAVEVGLDKLSTAQFLANAGIPVPWTVAASPEALPPTYPCIFKPRRSAGSRGVVICQDEDEAVWHASKVNHAVFQELLLPADREVTCAIYRTLDGRTNVLTLLRQLVGGFTGWAQVLDLPDVVAQCVVLAEALDLRGAINVQLRITDKGPRIFEINPRLSSTVYLRHLLGYCDVQWILDEYEGRAVCFLPVRIGAIAVRTQSAAVLN